MMENSQQYPICVDLDGTLVWGDQLWESLVQFIKLFPYKFWLVFLWLFRGKHVLKAKLAAHITCHPEHLPYNEPLLTFLQDEARKGTPLYLITGSNEHYGAAIAHHLKIFTKAWGSTAEVNLTSHTKAAFLKHYFGGSPFIYAGNSKDDLPIWEIATHALVINPCSGTLREVKKLRINYTLHTTPSAFLKNAWRLMRPYQWVKNSLLFIPLVLNNVLNHVSLIPDYLIALLSFSLSCSFVYIVNDMCDLPQDRTHPRKRTRPLAKGALSIPLALLLGGALFVISLLLALLFEGGVWMVLGYVALASLYTFKVKELPLLDVVWLAFLYVYRIVVGCFVGKLECSPWILGFSFFLFLGLGFLKRYTEIAALGAKRGYRAKDQNLLQTAGITNGLLAVAIFVLYIESTRSHTTFSNPIVLWGMIPALIYGFLRLWYYALHGKMFDDPIVFLFRDKISLLGLFYLSLCFAAAMWW